MKQSLLLVLILSCSLHSRADESSSFGDLRKLDASKFSSLFHLKGEVFVLDATGKRLVAQLPEERKWTAGAKSKKIESNWSIKAREIRPIVLHHEWELHDDNSVTGVIQQFEAGTPRGKLVREQKFNLESFAPITWVAQTNGPKDSDYQVVVRLTPQVESYREVENIGKIRIGGDRDSFQVSDNQGYLWADEVRFGGTIVGLKSHRGAVIISLYPFKGASELGSAQGKTIELKLNEKLRLKIQNDAELIPGEVIAKIYGIYLPHFKTTSPNSNWSFGQDKYESIPKDFIEALKQ